MNDVAGFAQDQAWQPSFYAQLHRIAEWALQRERPGHSLQPTLLVNDAYMRLLEQRNISPSDRSAVIAAGATIIRRLLVDYARKRKSQKRGGNQGRGGQLHVSIAESTNHLDVLELNDALEALSRHRPRAAQVVELKFFGGLTSEEVGEQIGISIRTVKSDWRFAKAWLYRELGSREDESGV